MNFNIEQIEKQYDVQQLKLNEIELWPIVKYILLDYNVPKKQYQKTIIYNVLASFLSCIIHCFKTINYNLKTKKLKSQSKNSKLIYVANSDERRDKIENLSFSKWADSLKNLSTNVVDLRIIEYEGNSGYQTPTYTQVEQISWQIYFWSFYYWLFQSFQRKTSSIIDQQNILKDVNIINKDHSIINNLVYEYRKIESFHLGFKKRLKNNKPSAVLFTFFPVSMNFGLILACKHLKIKSIDLQHGQQGDANPMYAQWHSNTNKNIQFKLLPDVFWMWGKRSAQRIEKWNHKNKIIIGGNSWMALNKKIFKPKSFDANRKKNILVATQHLNDFLNSYLINYIILDREFNWYIRIHPKYKHVSSQFEEPFSQPNIFFKEANTEQLYPLLNKCDFTITFWSTVAYEALYFNSHPIIIHPYGKKSMKSYIDQEIFAYAGNNNELKFALKEHHYKTEKDPYILSNSDIIVQNLVKQI